MGNLRRISSALVMVVAAAACGDDGASNPDALVIIDAPNPDAPNPDAPPPIDAPNYDFSCYQNQAPTTATATVAISGTAQEVVVSGLQPSIQAAEGVSIQACRGNCQGPNNLGTTGPTPATGTYMTDAITSNSMPVDGYLIATKTGNWTTRMYPASPLTMNEAGVPVLMLSAQLIPLLSFANIDQDPGNGMVIVLVSDCGRPPLGIGAATVSVTDDGTAVGEPPESAGMLDPQAEGAFLVANVPPGTVTVNATYNGMTFRAHDVGVVADQLTITQVKPGF